ncbi:MAG: hypothetical protein MUE68_11085 [Bacteroidetes bacterium]|jgi:hypothetical protein|nr:hypothetical protein [Bacteroidota bacterium]
MKHMALLWWALTSIVMAQESLDPSVRSLRVLGLGMRGLAIAVDDRGIRVEFEGTTPQPVDYRMRIRHLDLNGRETDNVFINDPIRMSSLEAIPHRPAPSGVRTWRWKYTTTIPGPKGIEDLPYSGYYRAWIEEAETGRSVGVFDFVRAERDVSALMRVRQRRLPSAVAPYDRGISVSLTIPLDAPWSGEGSVQPLLIRSVDVVKNREWSRRTRVEVYDDDPHTWVDGAGPDRMTFVAAGFLAGNEYRQIDLSNLGDYPPGDTLRPRSGADVSRFFFPGRPDRNGLASYSESIGGSDEELVEFQFKWSGDENGDVPSIALVGEFSGWKVRPEWEMAYDRSTRRHFLRKPLRRGRYDYQYVLNGNDWVRLEGSDWATSNLYTAFIVYHDQRFGGYDRIIGVAQLESTGAQAGEETRETD